MDAVSRNTSLYKYTLLPRPRSGTDSDTLFFIAPGAGIGGLLDMLMHSLYL